MTNAPRSFLDSLLAAIDAELKRQRTPSTPSLTDLLSMVIGSPPAKDPDPSPYDDPRAPSPHVTHPPDTAAEAQAQFDARRQNTEETSRLPTLRAGIYRHFKHGHLYQVLGYAKDAEPPTHDPDRIVVVYLSLKPTTAGHSVFTRPVQHFFQQVCLSSGRPLGSCNQHLSSSDCKLVDRFTYVGPEYPV